MIMKHDGWEMRFPREMRGMEVQDAGLQWGLFSPTRCPPGAHAWDENAAQRSLRNSPLKTIRPPLV